ncbi:MAG: helix-turn-helix transcriptional regulator [Leptolyngbyaceae cyanobacterium MAG.088]|nr:helix-turn-helix transcriptional regulator [Leptolyngbyaceae cyanobacterium MAG.088]
MAYQIQFVPSVTPAKPQPQKTTPTNAYESKPSFDMRAALLLAAIENSTFGLVIVSQDGAILHKNKRAELFLEELACSSNSKVIPNILWRPCQSLMENQQDESDLFPADYTIVLEDEIATDHGDLIHRRVQWFDWDNSDYKPCNCFLITLENRQQSLTAIAQHEAQRYGLTTRETDVWCLKRMGNSYKDIAQKLFISENTVKKHLKSIYVKKEQASW